MAWFLIRSLFLRNTVHVITPFFLSSPNAAQESIKSIVDLFNNLIERIAFEFYMVVS